MGPKREGGLRAVDTLPSPSRALPHHCQAYAFKPSSLDLKFKGFPEPVGAKPWNRKAQKKNLRDQPYILHPSVRESCPVCLCLSLSTAYNELPPLHKEVVADFFKSVENEEGDIINRVETTIDKVSTQHNVNTEILYNYINNETGV